MGYKDLGPGVSQNPADIASGNAFSGEDKAFEDVVILEDKPVIDWEMNLRGELAADHGWRLSNQRRSPSCFMVADALERSDVLGSYFFLAPAPGTENKFRLRATDALVNGWPVRVEYSDTTDPGFNDITLTAPPAAGVRIDLVILEVWRALVTATPSVVNKSPTSLILRHGNVRAPDGVNFSDDLIDPTFALESSARVQIQYRLRVIEGVNIDTYPDGLDDPTVVAHSVSDFGGPGADGTATVLMYSPAAGDAGLWTAGTGDAAGAATLGTVDGFMYAVPVCAVARRNTTTFARGFQQNGGNLIAAAPAERPDGAFADEVIAEDVRDLRKVCAQNSSEVLQKAWQQVLDNSLTTQMETSAIGTAGTSVFMEEEIDGSNHISRSDTVRRHFSDRSVTETIVVEVEIFGLPESVIDIFLGSLKLEWDPSATNLTFTSLDVNITGVKAARLVPNAGTDKDLFDSSNPVFVDRMEIRTVTVPDDTLTLHLNTTVTLAKVFVEIMIEYPRNLGVGRNMLRAHAFWTNAPAASAWVDEATWLSTVDAFRDEIPFPVPGYSRNQWWVDPGHRELSVRYETVTQAGVTYYTTALDTLLIRERLNGDPITIDDGTNPPYATTNYTFNTAWTTVMLTGGVPIVADTAVSVDYVAFRPLPRLGFPAEDSHELFYQSAAIQSLLPPAGTQTLNLVPRDILNFMAVLPSGSGSPDDTFPFVQPSAQIPVGALPSPDFPEAILDNPSDISLRGFGINAGFLQIPALIPYVPLAQEMRLFRDAPDPVTDADGRNFWPKSDDGTVPLYSPVVFGQELAFPQRHKVAVPLLAELKEDFPSIGRKGTLVLVVLTRWINFDAENSVVLLSTPSESAAAIYRVRGNMMNPQRTNP